MKTSSIFGRRFGHSKLCILITESYEMKKKIMSGSLNSYETYTAKEKEYLYYLLLLTFCILVRFHERYITISCFVAFFQNNFHSFPLIFLSLPLSFNFPFFISFFDFLIIICVCGLKTLKASSIHNVI